MSDRNLTIASALATVLSKTFQLKSPGVQSHIEKCPTFVSKDKRPKLFGHRNKKTVQLQGHHFEIKHYHELTYCTHSQQMIWGIGPQGYKCSCKFSSIIYFWFSVAFKFPFWKVFFQHEVGCVRKWFLHNFLFSTFIDID